MSVRKVLRDVSLMRLAQAGLITQAAPFSTCIMLSVLAAMGAMKPALMLLPRGLRRR